MPELPEVESLAVFLRDHAVGHAVARADAASFSVLKTFDPPLASLKGQVITEVGRHGKFLDLATDQGLHLIMHLARAGWLRWREELPSTPPKPGKSPLAFRLALEGGSGFDLTEQGTHKRLAVYLVRDPAEVPGVATLGPDPLAADFTVDTLAAPAGRTPYPGQGRAPRPADHRGHRQRLLRRGAARGEDVTIQDRGQHDAGRRGHLVRRDQDDAHRSGRAVGGLGRRRTEEREEERPARTRPDRPGLPGVRRHRPGGLVRRLRAPVLRQPARQVASPWPTAACPACSNSRSGLIIARDAV